MPSFSQNDVVLVRYPFSDLSSAKVRPAVVVNTTHASKDLILVALTSKTSSLLSGEFALQDWQHAGLNVETAVKRGVFTIDERLVIKSVGVLSGTDVSELERSLRLWLGLN